MRVEESKTSAVSARKPLSPTARKAASEEDRFLRIQLEAQIEYTKLLESASDEERRLRHDFRQHVRILSELAREGKTDELVDYLAIVEEASTQHARCRFTSNVELDALVNYYGKLAASRGIAFDAAVKLPDDFGISAVDLGVIVGNLLENAIDAAALCSGEEVSEASSRGWVFFGAQAKAGHVVFMVENTYFGEVRVNQGRFASTKHTGAGIGIASAQSTVERLGGLLSIRFDGDVFRAQASIPICATEIFIA